jgi:hypothetical protein
MLLVLICRNPAILPNVFTEGLLADLHLDPQSCSHGPTPQGQ